MGQKTAKGQLGALNSGEWASVLVAGRSIDTLRLEDDASVLSVQFDHILAELSEINKTADDVVQSNIEALGAISASGERIDRLNRDNEHSLARLVTGSFE